MSFNSEIRSFDERIETPVDEKSSSTASDLDEEEGPVPLEPLPLSLEEHKLVLVVRTDLGMGKGKVAAQCGHATLACYKRATKLMPLV